MGYFQESSGIYWSNIDVGDPWVSRGWESSRVIVGDLRGVTGVEILVMRTLDGVLRSCQTKKDSTLILNQNLINNQFIGRQMLL